MATNAEQTPICLDLTNDEPNEDVFEQPERKGTRKTKTQKKERCFDDDCKRKGPFYTCKSLLHGVNDVGSDQASTCGALTCVAHSTFCTKCKTLVCHGCAERCFCCNALRCNKCFFPCTGCDDVVCAICIKKCQCGDSFCTNCASPCEDCNEERCSLCIDDCKCQRNDYSPVLKRKKKSKRARQDEEDYVMSEGSEYEAKAERTAAECNTVTAETMSEDETRDASPPKSKPQSPNPELTPSTVDLSGMAISSIHQGCKSCGRTEVSSSPSDSNLPCNFCQSEHLRTIERTLSGSSISSSKEEKPEPAEASHEDFDSIFDGPNEVLHTPCVYGDRQAAPDTNQKMETEPLQREMEAPTTDPQESIATPVFEFPEGFFKSSRTDVPQSQRLTESDVIEQKVYDALLSKFRAELEQMKNDNAQNLGLLEKRIDSIQESLARKPYSHETKFSCEACKQAIGKGQFILTCHECTEILCLGCAHFCKDCATKTIEEFTRLDTHVERKRNEKSTRRIAKLFELKHAPTVNSEYYILCGGCIDKHNRLAHGAPFAEIEQ